MRNGLLGYLKTGKKNEFQRTNYLARRSNAWGLQQEERFARLYYPRYSETFFRKMITLFKHALIMLHRIIAIKNLNNIMFNCFQNPHLIVLSDKWHFDYSQDQKTLVLDFDSFNIYDIADESFRALDFHISVTGYLEKTFPHFTDITDLKLNVEPTMVDNFGQVVTDSKEEVVKKKNKYIAKRKK